MNLDALIKVGYTIEIMPVLFGDDQTRVQVRLTSPGKHVNTGIGDTSQDALIVALWMMVTRVEEYLNDTEIQFKRAEEELHRRGIVVNGLDLEEVKRMQTRLT